jgi:ribosomal protein S6--L-glutamate ligase
MRQDLRIGIVTGDLDGWHTNQLLQAATKVAQAQVVDPLGLSLRIDDDGAGVWFGGERAEVFDALLLRGLNGDGLTDLQLEGYRLLEGQVAVVVNRVGPILTALDKARTSFLLRRAGLPTPPTVITQRPEEAEAAVERFGEAVLKPLYGSLGEDMARVVPGGEASDRIRHMLSSFGAVYVQRFEPPGGRDIRAFVVGGQVVAAIYRVAQEGQWITNVYQGASTEPVELPDAVQELCVKAAAVVDLDYTGVDLIETSAGPTVLEVNGTPAWMGVDAAWHRSMAEEIVGHVVRLVDEDRRSGRRYASFRAIA